MALEEENSSKGVAAATSPELISYTHVDATAADATTTTKQTMTRLTLLFEKDLKHSDVNRRQSRLVIPANQAPSIIAALQDSVRSALQHHPERGVTIEFHEQLPADQEEEEESRRVWPWLFKQWKSSRSYVLIHGWIDFVLARNLPCGSKVRFFCDESSHTFYVSAVPAQAQAQNPSLSNQNSNGKGNGRGSSSSSNTTMEEGKMVESEPEPEPDDEDEAEPEPEPAAAAQVLQVQVEERSTRVNNNKNNTMMDMCLCLRLRTGRSYGDPVLCPTCEGLL